jgi:hypothetical protein
MDIAGIKAETRTIEILHPATGEQIGLSIQLRPQSSAEVEKVKRKITNRRLAQRTMKTTAASLEADAFEILLACVAGWEWKKSLTFHGKMPECTPENVRAVFDELSWVRDQIDREAGDSEAFFTA